MDTNEYDIDETLSGVEQAKIRNERYKARMAKIMADFSKVHTRNCEPACYCDSCHFYKPRTLPAENT